MIIFYIRLDARHQGGDGDVAGFKETLLKMYSLYEAAESDEKNTYNVVVNEHMTLLDVVAKVQAIVEKI